MGKKILFVSFLCLYTLALSGCVKKTEAPVKVDNLVKDNLPPAAPTTQEEVLPKATGKADDLVDAATQGADSEKTTLLEEENAASDLAKDAEEINNLQNSYDENEL